MTTTMSHNGNKDVNGDISNGVNGKEDHSNGRMEKESLNNNGVMKNGNINNNNETLDGHLNHKERLAALNKKMHKMYLNEWPEDTKELYDTWAKTIDKDYTVVGYNGPPSGAEVLERWVPNKEAEVLDVACGTGLVGEQLALRGYKNFDGIDFSSDSIKVSEEKGNYRRLICDKFDPEHRDNIQDDAYDAALCVGAFIAGHLTQKCFPEFVRIVKPGGIVIIAMREEYLDLAPEFSDGKLEGAMDDYVKEKKWEALAREPIDRFFSHHSGIAFVFRVL